MQLKKFEIFSTIKFKLAMTFTVILFVFSGVIILFFNIAINNYLSTRAQPEPVKSPMENRLPKANNTLPVKNAVKVIGQENGFAAEMRAVYANDLENIQRISVISLLPLALISLLLGYFLAGRFLRPLNELNVQIDKLKSENLGNVINVIPQNEIGKTIKSFNEMSLRLQRSFDQQTRFVQDASHELRTPLTIVRTNLETVLDDNEASITDLREAGKNALDGLDSVTQLANDLLTLSRPQSNKRSVEAWEIIVRETVDSMKEVAAKNGVFLNLKNGAKGAVVMINKLDVMRALKNVIDNAINYSKEVKRPSVLVRSYFENNYAVVEIKDNGKGIPSSDLDKIFDRFFRVDKSRDRETGGFGLGLPITKKIIEDHSGQILVNSDSNLTIFTLKVPLMKMV